MGICTHAVTKLSLCKLLGCAVDSFLSSILKNTVEAKTFLEILETLNTNFNIRLEDMDSCKPVHGKYVCQSKPSMATRPTTLDGE